MKTVIVTIQDQATVPATSSFEEKVLARVRAQQMTISEAQKLVASHRAKSVLAQSVA